MTLGEVLENDVTAKHPMENTLRIKRKVACHDSDVKLIISTMTPKFRPGVKLAAIFEPQTLQTKVAMAKLAMEILKRTQIL